MDLTEALEKLQQFKEKYQQKYKFRRIGIFGSTARGTWNELSDIDIVIEQKQT